MVKLKICDNISYTYIKEQCNHFEDDLCTEIQLLKHRLGILNSTSVQTIYE